MSKFLPVSTQKTQRKVSWLFYLLCPDRKVRNAGHLSQEANLKRPSPWGLSGSAGTCRAMGHCNRRAEAHCQNQSWPWHSPCAPQVLTFLCKTAWFGLAAQTRALMVLMMVAHLRGHCAKCSVCTFSFSYDSHHQSENRYLLVPKWKSRNKTG